MGKRYYIVSQDLPREARVVSELHGLAFVAVSGDSVEHIAGDRGITKMLKLTDGEIKPKKGSYGVESVGPIQFDIQVDSYLNQILYEERERAARISLK